MTHFHDTDFHETEFGDYPMTIPHRDNGRQAPDPSPAVPFPSLDLGSSSPDTASSSPDAQRLGDLLAQARELVEAGGLSPAATDRQKWQAGDLVNAMQRVVSDARDRLLDPQVSVTPQARADYRACAAAFDAFLGAQGLTRGTLVDAALTAATFPPGDPVRHIGLSFSHARTLSRLGGDRAAWAARAVRENLSVGRLQALINTREQALINTSQTGDRPNRGGERRPSHSHVCAYSGEAITDLAAMVELRVPVEVMGEAALSAIPVRTSARGGAARLGPDGAPRRRTLLLRFAHLTALHEWLAEWEQSRLMTEVQDLLAAEAQDLLAPEVQDPPGA